MSCFSKVEMSSFIRLEVLQKLLTRELSQTKASEALQISVRQVQRLIRAYNSSGAFGLVSKKRGKPGNKTLPNTIKQYAIRLIKDHYLDFGPTLAVEKLLEKHDLKLSIETVRNLMIKASIWLPKNKRHKRLYQPRYRREGFGGLIQIDGSTHYWFEDKGPRCTLLVYVDDATRPE